MTVEAPNFLIICAMSGADLTLFQNKSFCDLSDEAGLAVTEVFEPDLPAPAESVGELATPFTRLIKFDINDFPPLKYRYFELI